MAKYTVRYVHQISNPKSVTKLELYEIRNGAFSNRNTLARELRQLGILGKGCRIREMRVEGDKTIVFPACPGLTTYWHSIVLTHVS